MSGAPSLATWGLVAAAVLCNASAQVLMKLANVTDAGNLRHWFHPWLLLAVGLYGFSFLLTALVYARMPLSLISPLMAGAIFVLISLAAALLLHEAVGPLKLAGMACIVLGIVLLSQSR